MVINLLVVYLFEVYFLDPVSCLQINCTSVAIPGVKDRLKGGVTPPTRTEGAPARPRKSSHGKSEEATSGKKSCATKGNRDEEGATRSTTTKKNEATTQKTSSASPLPGL